MPAEDDRRDHRLDALTRGHVAPIVHWHSAVDQFADTQRLQSVTDDWQVIEAASHKVGGRLHAGTFSARALLSV